MRNSESREAQDSLKETVIDRIKENTDNNKAIALTPDYGTSYDNPVYANLVGGSYSYLCKLWADKETPLVWERVGTVDSTSSPDPIDQYDFYDPSGAYFGTIFVNMYSNLNPKYVPVSYYSPELPTLQFSKNYDIPNRNLADVNSVTIGGELCKDVVYHVLSSGTPVATLPLRIRLPLDTEKYMTFDAIAWRDLADLAKEEIKVGDHLIVVGNLMERKWEDRHGNVHVVHEIYCNYLYKT